MTNKKFLLLENNSMALYTLGDLYPLENVIIYHFKHVSDSWLLNLLYNIHNSGRIQRYFNLPFKWIWDKILFDKLFDSFIPDYIVITTSWYSEHLLSYFRQKSRKSKLILRFSDKVVNGLKNDNQATISRIRDQFDGVLVYSQEDAKQYDFTYHSVGYSRIKKDLLKPCKNYDVVFIGADKGRIDKIRYAYNKFVAAGLSCFFYVIMVKKQDRKNDGIIYADKVMPFNEYLSYELSAKCLFELVQEGSSGRTFRMMESIINNKLLITNCSEITRTDYYNQNYVQLFDDVSEIDPMFIVNCPQVIDYHYKEEFSPLRVLDFIESRW